MSFLEDQISEIANQQMDKLVGFGIVAAKLQTPVDKGALRNSIRANKRLETTKSIEQEIEWGNIESPNDGGELVGVSYQAFVALGTSKQAANAYHIRTFEDIESNFSRIIT